MRKEGRAAPMVVQMAPGSFFSLYPTKTLMFMARAPGQLCATAMRSRNSSRLIQFFRSTTSASIAGIMAYPPPSVNSPIFEKTRNASI